MRPAGWRWALLLVALALLVLLPATHPQVLAPEARAHLQQLASSGRYRHWDLIGTAAFAVHGFSSAQQRRYDLWGAFVLTLLPAVGGGVIRDVLIGGERLPLLLFRDSAYLLVVLAVVVMGALCSTRRLPYRLPAGWPGRLLLLADGIGLASFAVIGTRVALLAGVPWYWLPVSAAVSCTGGGSLMDIATGREPRTFQGEPYEEIAILGSLLLMALWVLVDRCGGSGLWIAVAMAISWLSMLILRCAVVQHGWRSWRLGCGRRSSP